MRDLVRLVSHGGPVPPTVPIDFPVRLSLSSRGRRRGVRSTIVLARGRDERRRANARATREERASQKQARGFHDGGDARDDPDASVTRCAESNDSTTMTRARWTRGRETTTRRARV